MGKPAAHRAALRGFEIPRTKCTQEGGTRIGHELNLFTVSSGRFLTASSYPDKTPHCLHLQLDQQIHNLLFLTPLTF